jgi:hypothetical protein
MNKIQRFILLANKKKVLKYFFPMFDFKSKLY